MKAVSVGGPLLKHIQGCVCVYVCVCWCFPLEPPLPKNKNVFGRPWAGWFCHTSTRILAGLAIELQQGAWRSRIFASAESFVETPHKPSRRRLMCKYGPLLFNSGTFEAEQPEWPELGLWENLRASARKPSGVQARVAKVHREAPGNGARCEGPK